MFQWKKKYFLAVCGQYHIINHDHFYYVTVFALGMRNNYDFSRRKYRLLFFYGN